MTNNKGKSNPIVFWLFSSSERMFGDESILEEATEEMKRAISLKAVEAFMEAAPQFFLQVWLTRFYVTL